MPVHLTDHVGRFVVGLDGFRHQAMSGKIAPHDRGHFRSSTRRVDAWRGDQPAAEVDELAAGGVNIAADSVGQCFNVAHPVSLPP